ncbi:hypothetical protein E4U60_003178 [Claviceps pazoutovae]|uniref:Uncharacterized protein n=1 Tax=Claviceps pazoutovae TaxID=1649127 RepID=A0A9P7MAT1_9HYPO|nr:hypothetical protein E4U60_003178 [Claviceps pazoutovae]
MYDFSLLNKLVGSIGDNRTMHLGVVLMKHKDEITDNDGDFINALNAVFPETGILMYQRHMNKGAESYLRTQLSSRFVRRREGTRRIDNEGTNEFMMLYKSLMESPNVADYEHPSHEATAYKIHENPGLWKHGVQGVDESPVVVGNPELDINAIGLTSTGP